MSTSPRVFPITHEGNKISISGDITESDILGFEKCLFDVCDSKGFSDVILDFSNCTSVFQSFMVPAISSLRTRKLRSRVDATIVQSSNPVVRSLFHNANWSHLIAPEREEPSTFKGSIHVPAIVYRNRDEQFDAVDKIVDVVLSTVGGLNRGHLKAVEWCLNEIADNVLSHADSPAGGIMQLTTYGDKKRVQFVVADGGRGVQASLGVRDAEQALVDAITEGKTRSPDHQGNGLYGTFRIATVSTGFFELRSKNGVLTARQGKVGTHETKIPFNGTYVVCDINFDNDNLLEEALRFKGKSHDPGFDYLEKKYEISDDKNFHVKISEMKNLFGTREGGVLARTRLGNLLRASGANKVVLDFEHVVVFSSSFADEVFGKIFVELGPVLFSSKIEFENVDKTIKSLIDRAIYKRVIQDFM